MYCKTDKDTVSPVAGESAQCREMTPFDRIRGVTDTNRNATQTKKQQRSEQVERSKDENDRTVFA